jgi:hypothetical protein
MRHQTGIVLPGYNPLKVANAPTIGTATSASGTSVSVAFTAPACVGGGAISSYSAYCTTTGTNVTTGASSPLVVTGLTTGTAYTFRVSATNAFGPSYPSAASNSATPVAAGQQAYTTAGTYSWVAPSGVTSVSVVTVGGGGQGGARGGGGAELRYKNNISVTPGNSYSVVAGAVGSYCGPVSGGTSSFNSTTVRANGGGSSDFGTGGTIPGGSGGTGDGGGNGGSGGSSSGGYAGAGGAGGYSGAGGNGAGDGGGTSTAGSGGAGGGGGNNACCGSAGGGGGVGILGSGSNGAAGGAKTRGGGGSGGVGGSVTSAGGAYGGGGGASGGAPSAGAVRIIWPGNTRSFPSTNTGNL